MQVGVVRFRIFCPRRLDVPLLSSSQFRFKCSGDLLRDVALNLKNIDQLAIISFGPDMRIIDRIHKLNGDAHLVGRLLDATLKHVANAKLLRNISKIGRCALVFCRRSAGDNF